MHHRPARIFRRLSFVQSASVAALQALVLLTFAALAVGCAVSSEPAQSREKDKERIDLRSAEIASACAPIVVRERAVPEVTGWYESTVVRANLANEGAETQAIASEEQGPNRNRDTSARWLDVILARFNREHREAFGAKDDQKIDRVMREMSEFSDLSKYIRGTDNPSHAFRDALAHPQPNEEDPNDNRGITAWCLLRNKLPDGQRSALRTRKYFEPGPGKENPCDAISITTSYPYENGFFYMFFLASANKERGFGTKLLQCVAARLTAFWGVSLEVDMNEHRTTQRLAQEGIAYQLDEALWPRISGTSPGATVALQHNPRYRRTCGFVFTIANSTGARSWWARRRDKFTNPLYMENHWMALSGDQFGPDFHNADFKNEIPSIFANVTPQSLHRAAGGLSYPGESRRPGCGDNERRAHLCEPHLLPLFAEGQSAEATRRFIAQHENPTLNGVIGSATNWQPDLTQDQEAAWTISRMPPGMTSEANSKEALAR